MSWEENREDPTPDGAPSRAGSPPPPDAARPPDQPAAADPAQSAEPTAPPGAPTAPPAEPPARTTHLSSGPADPPYGPPPPPPPPPPLRPRTAGGGPARPPAKRRWTPTAVILALAAVVLFAGWVQKSPCLHSSGWPNGLQYKYACYSDVIPLYGVEGFEQNSFPYSHYWIEEKGKPTQYRHYMEYPVLTGLFMWAGGAISNAYRSVANAFIYLPTSQPQIVYFDVLAAFASLFWLLTVWLVTRMTGRRVWDGLIAALSPIVIVQAFTNFDMLAVALATGALFAWSRRRSVLAGVLIGLGTAAKLYPVLFLIPLLALCFRAGKMNEWGRATLAAGTSWLLVNAPIYLLYPHGWREFLHLNSTRGADPDSLYNVISQFTNWGGFDGFLLPRQTPTKLNEFIALMLIVGFVAIVLVIVSAPRRPRVAQVTFLAVAWFLLANKVWSPQYSLWLIPLAVLAVPRWKPLAAWMLIETWLWVTRMYFYLPTNQGGWGQDRFLITVIVRDLAVAALCALVVFEIYHPERDLVRLTGEDDPVGGVLADAPDRFRLRLRRRRAVPGVAPS